MPRFVKRSKKIENMKKLCTDDIMELISLTDENQAIDKLPCFVAKDLKRVPTLQPEQLDIYFVAKRMEMLEQRFAAMEAAKSDVSFGSGGTRSWSDVAASKPSHVPPVGMSSAPSGGPFMEWSDTPKVLSEIRVGESDGLSQGARVLRVDADNLNTMSGNADDQSKGDKWTVFNNKKNQKRKIVGSSENCKLVAANVLIKKRVIHVDNVCDETTCEKIDSFLKDVDIPMINCFKAKSWIKRKSENVSEGLAFRVCIEAKYLNQVLDSSIWPKGVLVREWKFKEKPKVNNDQSA